jgi:uncharacterized protein YjbI with pentapeptide repeats
LEAALLGGGAAKTAMETQNSNQGIIASPSNSTQNSAAPRRRSPFFTPTKPKHTSGFRNDDGGGSAVDRNPASTKTHQQSLLVAESLRALSSLAALPPTHLWLRMLRVLLRMPPSIIAAGVAASSSIRSGGAVGAEDLTDTDAHARGAHAVVADLLNGTSVADLTTGGDGGSIDRCTWRAAQWERAGLHGLHLTAVTARGLSLRGCDLRGVVFGPACRFIDCDFDGACLDGATVVVDPAGGGAGGVSGGVATFDPASHQSSTTAATFQNCSFRRASLGGLTIQISPPPKPPQQAQKMLAGSRGASLPQQAKFSIPQAFFKCDFDLAVISGLTLLGPTGRQVAATEAAFASCYHMPRME